MLLGKGRSYKGLKEALGGGQARIGSRWLMSNFSVSGWVLGMPQKDGACLQMANMLGVRISDNTVFSALKEVMWGPGGA